MSSNISNWIDRVQITPTGMSFKPGSEGGPCE